MLPSLGRGKRILSNGTRDSRTPVAISRRRLSRTFPRSADHAQLVLASRPGQKDSRSSALLVYEGAWVHIKPSLASYLARLFSPLL